MNKWTDFSSINFACYSPWPCSGCLIRNFDPYICSVALSHKRNYLFAALRTDTKFHRKAQVPETREVWKSQYWDEHIKIGNIPTYP